MTPDQVRFAVTGLDHGHIYAQTQAMLDAGVDLSGITVRSWLTCGTKELSKNKLGIHEKAGKRSAP